MFGESWPSNGATQQVKFNAKHGRQLTKGKETRSPYTIHHTRKNAPDQRLSHHSRLSTQRETRMWIRQRIQGVFVVKPIGAFRLTYQLETHAMTNSTTNPPDICHTNPIVFFDGVCGMCNQTVNTILRFDKSGSIRFAPLQGTTAKQTLPNADVDSLKSMVVVDERGTHRKSGAICRILFRLGSFWSIPGAMLWVIPYPLRDFGYSIVARYRYRFFGKHDVCRIPNADERDRFLD